MLPLQSDISAVLPSLKRIRINNMAAHEPKQALYKARISLDKSAYRFKKLTLQAF